MNMKLDIIQKFEKIVGGNVFTGACKQTGQQENKIDFSTYVI